MTDNVGEVVKGQAMEDFISALELRFYHEICGKPLKDFKQEFHDYICVLARLL